jgi:hypothetical protein
MLVIIKQLAPPMRDGNLMKDEPVSRSGPSPRMKVRPAPHFAIDAMMGTARFRTAGRSTR